MVYFVKDGGKVLDTSTAINVEAVTTGAAFLALALAQGKFEGQALRINGSDAFKRELIIVAASKDFTFRFADKAMNDALDIIKAQNAKDKSNLSELGKSLAKDQKPRTKPIRRGR